MAYLKQFMNGLAGIGVFLAGIGMLLIFGALFGIAFGYAVKHGLSIETFLSGLSGIAILITILVLLPLACFRGTRGFSGLVLMLFSYLFGLNVWFLGLIVTLSFWGLGWVILGIIFGGIGVIPLGLIASAIHGRWDLFWILMANIVFVALTRIIAAFLIAKADEDEAEDSEVPAIVQPDEDHTVRIGSLQTFPFIRWFYNLGELRLSKLSVELYFLIFVGLSRAFWPYTLGTLFANSAFILWVVIVGLLVGLALANHWTMLLPDKMVYPLMLLALVFQLDIAIALHSFHQLILCIIAALVNGIILFFGASLAGGRLVGGGDVKVAFLAGLLLSFPLGLISIWLLAVLMVLVYAVSKMMGPANYRSAVPSGSFWLISIILTLLFGHQFIALFTGS